MGLYKDIGFTAVDLNPNYDITVISACIKILLTSKSANSSEKSEDKKKHIIFITRL